MSDAERRDASAVECRGTFTTGCYRATDTQVGRDANPSWRFLCV